MPSKYQTITDMAAEASHSITESPENWMWFLITAANNYKYRFRDQLLIFAQKPDATACADIETWNRLSRWVNKGTKGIVLLVDRDAPYIAIQEMIFACSDYPACQTCKCRRNPLHHGIIKNPS